MVPVTTSCFVFNRVSLFIFQEYRILFEESGNNPGDKTLEDKFFEHEVCVVLVQMVVVVLHT